MNLKNIFMAGVLGVIFSVALSANVKAIGMPCTEAEIVKAQGLKAIADGELAQAVANKAQADAEVALLKAQGASELDMLIATNKASTAANIVRDYQGKVANAQTYIDELVSRATTEQYQLDMEAKWKQRANLDMLQLQLNAAKGTPAYDQILAEYNALYASGTWATNADNANYDKFVREYGTNLMKTYEIPGTDIKFAYYYPDKPNEWSIRWFE